MRLMQVWANTRVSFATGADLSISIYRRTLYQPYALLRMSLSSTNDCLRAVIEKGWVKMENFTRSQTKQRYLYLLTPEGAQAKLKVLNALIAQKRQEYAERQAFIEQLTREQRAQTQSSAKDPLPQQR